MNTPLAGESPASTHRSTYEDQSPFANPSYPSNFRKSYSSNNRETPATPTTPTTPSTDRLQTHSNRREKWLTNHSPSNHNHNHDKTILQPTRHILSQQEEYQDDKSHVIYSEDNKHCQKKSSIAGHEDDDQYFFETPKFILYAMRSYCLSKPCQKFKALFMQYDENSDGQLDTQEIHNGILRMGFEVPLSTAEEVMKMIDLDGNAQLDFAEFRCAILNERIAQDFEDHTRRMHNDCRLQDAYLKRCGEAPFAASQIGPAMELALSGGHHKAQNHTKKQMSVKQITLIDIEEKRRLLQQELAKERAADTARHGKKISKEHGEFMANLEDKFANLKTAFQKMDTDSSGCLDREEMAAVCVQLNLPESWTVALMEEADKDGDGEISYNEFVKALERTSSLGMESHEAEGGEFDEFGENEEDGLFADVMGNFNYREGEALPPAKLPAGVNFHREDTKGKMFSAHASHLSRTVSQVLGDGVSVCCVRPRSYNVKKNVPDFLK